MDAEANRDEGEREEYDGRYRSFRWDVPAAFNIGTAIADAHLEEGAGDVAIYYESETGQDANWRFRDLADRSNRLAKLLTEVGVERGDRVGVSLPSRPETVVTLAAIYKLGGIALSISSLLGTEAISFRLRHSGARALFLEGDRRDVRKEVARLEDLKTTVVVEGEGLSGKETSFDEVRKNFSSSAPIPATVVAGASSDPAHLFYTSGTTGPPKGALHAHRFLLGHTPCFQIYFEAAPRRGDVYWTPADWGWIGALGDVVLPALYFGMPVVASRRRERFDPRAALELMERYGVTCAFIPPTALRLTRKTVEHPRRQYPSLNLRAVCSAGESVGADLIEWGQRELGAPVNEFYGCTEANLVVVSSPALMRQRPGAMGKPCPGHRVEVVGEDGEALAPGELGQIAVGRPDPVLFLGYWDDDEATRKKYRGEWFLTGDLGWKDQAGYLWFKGRMDDVIKASGYRIGPEEVEAIVNQHPAVLESGVVARPDPVRGSIVKAFVVLRRDVGPSQRLEEEIQALVRERLAAYAYPREIEFVAELPKTVTGKIRRAELRRGP